MVSPVLPVAEMQAPVVSPVTAGVAADVPTASMPSVGDVADRSDLVAGMGRVGPDAAEQDVLAEVHRLDGSDPAQLILEAPLEVAVGRGGCRGSQAEHDGAEHREGGAPEGPSGGARPSGSENVSIPLHRSTPARHVPGGVGRALWR